MCPKWGRMLANFIIKQLQGETEIGNCKVKTVKFKQSAAITVYVFLSPDLYHVSVLIMSMNVVIDQSFQSSLSCHFLYEF